jgi:hypothetical protein
MAERRNIAVDPQIADMLRSERERPDPPMATKSSVRTRLQASIVGIAALGEPTAMAPTASSGSSPAPHALGPKLFWTGLGALAVVSGGYLLAARTGRWEHRPQVAVETPRLDSLASPPPAGPNMPTVAPEPIAPPLLPNGSTLVPSRPSVRRHVSPAPALTASPAETGIPTDEALRREQEIVRRARLALRSGDTAQALQLLTQHAQDFPAGRLAEERDGLQVRALLQEGDERAARGRLDEMSRRFPDSPLLPGLRQAVGEAP